MTKLVDTELGRSDVAVEPLKPTAKIFANTDCSGGQVAEMLSGRTERVGKAASPEDSGPLRKTEIFCAPSSGRGHYYFFAFFAGAFFAAFFAAFLVAYFIV